MLAKHLVRTHLSGSVPPMEIGEFATDFILMSVL